MTSWTPAEKTVLKKRVDDLLAQARKLEAELVQEAQRKVSALVELAKTHTDQQAASKEAPRG